MKDAPLLILADDFTGSLDTGVHFAKQGVSTVVQIADREDSFPSDTDAQVLVLDTESRHLSAEHAYNRISALTRQARREGVRSLYKKVDSTLRGNIGAELTAVLDNWPAKQLVFLPAFPKAGRTTEAGIQYVHGIPLAETSFATDPFNPVRSSRVSEIIGAQSSVPVLCRQRYEADSSGEKRILVLDSSSDSDLRQVGEDLSRAGENDLLAGCAGFAEQLPALLDLKKSPMPAVVHRGGTLLICGSLHPISLQQADYAQTHCGYHGFSLSAEQLLGLEPVESLPEIIRLLAAGERVMLRGGGGQEQLVTTEQVAEAAGISRDEVPARIAAGFGRLTAQIVPDGTPGTLIVFGGDTLLGIVRALGGNSLIPLAEVCPGVVLARSDRRLAFQGNLVTKAGGFGEESLVKTIDRKLSG